MPYPCGDIEPEKSFTYNKKIKKRQAREGEKEVFMFTIFLKHKFLSVLILCFLIFSIVCQMVIGVLFQMMIKESENMPTTENRLLNQCKLKFINCYQLNGKITNTSVFVDKFISRISFLGISLKKLTHLSGQLMMLSILMTGIAVCICLTAGDTLFQIIPYYLSSILGLYLYFSVSALVDLSGKKALLKTNLTDYLENHLLPRMEIEKEQARIEEEAVKKEEPSAVTASANYQEELEDLLKEFFA